ncbi:MAG: hypothetical protein ACC726_05170 [Chloroflexota bacterium]
MTGLMMRLASESYLSRLAQADVEDGVASSAVEAFRDALKSVAPGGTTSIEPARLEGLLPGFREAMADGLSFSLWLVAVATILATIATVFLFRWAQGRDQRPEAPIAPDALAPGAADRETAGRRTTP